MFTKDMLMPGKHIVETKQGRFYLVLGDNILQGVDLENKKLTEWINLADYKQDLSYWSAHVNRDIVKVYSIITTVYIFSFGSIELGELVWERDPEVEEMTMEQVCEALGKNVKIVKEN